MSDKGGTRAHLRRGTKGGGGPWWEVSKKKKIEKERKSGLSVGEPGCDRPHDERLA